MQGQDTVIVVVMEFCDLGSLMRAVNKKAFSSRLLCTHAELAPDAGCKQYGIDVFDA